MNNQYNPYDLYGNVTVGNKEKGFEMKNKDRIFSLFIALLIVPSVALTLWGGFNLGYTLSFIALALTFSIYLASKTVKFKIFPYICLLCSLGGAAVYSVSADGAVRFFLFLPVTVMLFIWFVYLGGYNLSSDYSLISAVFIGVFGSAFGSMGKSLAGVFSFGNKKGKGVGKALIGILCSIPTVLIVVALLRSSDAAFDGLLSKIGDSFGSFGTVVLKISVGLLVFPLAVSLGLGLKHNKREQKEWQIKGGIDKAIVISFLSVLSLVYVVYIFSQLAYFFSAFKGMLPLGEDITFASYARRGFFEMTVIAAINFALIGLAAVLVKRKENGKRNGFLNGIIVFIAMFTLLLIATALSKMFLYIENFGMTRLRILTSVFMVFLAVLFLAVLLRTFIKRVPVIKTGIVAAVVLLTVVGFADVDKTVAEYNLYAYETQITESLDVEAIGDLGTGGVPTLYKIYKNETYPIELRFAAREELVKKCERMYNVEYEEGKRKYIRESEAGDFNLSAHKAYEILELYIKD